MCTSALLPASGESQRPEQGWRVEHWRYTTVGQEEWVCSLYLAQDPTGKKTLVRWHCKGKEPTEWHGRWEVSVPRGTYSIYFNCFGKAYPDGRKAELKKTEATWAQPGVYAGRDSKGRRVRMQLISTARVLENGLDLRHDFLPTPILELASPLLLRPGTGGP